MSLFISIFLSNTSHSICSSNTYKLFRASWNASNPIHTAFSICMTHMNGGNMIGQYILYISYSIKKFIPAGITFPARFQGEWVIGNSSNLIGCIGAFTTMDGSNPPGNPTGVG